jgi:hypothetical protein
MAKTKSKGVQAAVPYIRRAVEDEYAQEQFRNAAARLRDVYGRVSRQQAAAAEDKGLYRSLKAAAVSLRRAVGRIEEPPPPRHTLRNGLVIGGVAAGGAVLAVVRRRRKAKREMLVEPVGYPTSVAEPAPMPAPAA